MAEKSEYEKYVVNMTQNAENDLNEIIMFIAQNKWKIIYKVDKKTVNILAIIDSRRNLHDLLIKKLLK